MSLFVLSNTNKRFRASLETPTAIGSVDIVVTWAESGDNYFAEDSSEYNLTTTSTVDVVTPPSAGRKRVIKSISIFNKDIDPRTVYLTIFDGTHTFTVAKIVVPNGSGWSSDVTTAGGTSITDGLKGDINVTGNGSTWTVVDGALTGPELATNAVSTDKIANDAVTNAKLLNDSVTIAGNSVALGGSVSRDQVTGLSADGIVKRSGADNLTQAVAGTDYSPALVAGTNITLTPTVDNKITVASTAGGVTNGDKGDITVTNAGTPTENWAIDPRSVTYDKIEEVAGSRLLGRSSSTPGDIQEIELGTGLTFNNNKLDSAGGGRPALTATRNYFVAPATGSVPSTYLGFSGWVNGNDNNDGLSQTTPFASIQKAINTTNALDTVIYTVNIYICKGTYNETLSVISPNLTTQVNIIGDTTNWNATPIIQWVDHGASDISGWTNWTRQANTSQLVCSTTNLVAPAGGTNRAAVQPNFLNWGWAAGDSVMVANVQSIGSLTTYVVGNNNPNINGLHLTGQGTQAYVTTATGANINLGDTLCIPGGGPTRNFTSGYWVNGLTGNSAYSSVVIAKQTVTDSAGTSMVLLTFRGALSNAVASGTVYKLYYNEYVLTGVTSNTLTTSGIWPSTANNSTIPGYCVIRIPNVRVVSNSTTAHTLTISNARTYSVRGLALISSASTGTAGCLTVTKGSATPIGNIYCQSTYNGVGVAFALFFVSDCSTVSDLVTGMVTCLGSATWNMYFMRGGIAQVSRLTHIGGQYGWGLTGLAGSRGNVPTGVFSSRPANVLEVSYCATTTAVSCGSVAFTGSGAFTAASIVY